MLRFYNTLTRHKDDFHPLEPGRVHMYTCGPTVWNYPHIGNYRAYIFEDLLRRYLKYRGYTVTQVMNLTDVEDKTIRDSQKAGMSLRDFTAIYTRAFFEDLRTLNIEPAEVYPAAALPSIAKASGAVVIEVNPKATALSPTADYALRGPAGSVLPALVQEAWPDAPTILITPGGRSGPPRT